jgi:RNA polymerase sigma-70 factor (sigma-E family)
VRDVDREFRDFVAAQLTHLRTLAYLTCGDWQVAEDAVLTALTRMHPRWRRIDQPQAYARRAVIRAAVDEVRRPWWRREESTSHAMPEPAVADATGAVHDRLQVHAALQRIPVRLRAVLVLRFIEGFSVAETAEALGCPEGTVKNYTSRALDAMRRVLGVDDFTIEEGCRAHGSARPAARR